MNAPCLPSGKCVEANTVCEAGVCRCAAGYFLKSRRVCGKSSRVVFRLAEQYFMAIMIQ